MPHFIRGYFDGEGSLTIGKRGKPKIVIASAFSFLPKAEERFPKEVVYHIYSKKGVDSRIGIMEIAAQFSVRTFLDWIYDDAHAFCSRKHDRYYNYYYRGKELSPYPKYSQEELLREYGYEDIVPNS